MGKGDRKTKKGKRTIGSYGNSRKRKSNVKVEIPVKKKKTVKKKETKASDESKPVKKAPAKKAPAKKKASNEKITEEAKKQARRRKAVKKVTRPAKKAKSKKPNSLSQPPPQDHAPCIGYIKAVNIAANPKKVYNLFLSATAPETTDIAVATNTT